MNRKLYVELIEAELQRRSERIRELEREVDELKDKCDPTRKLLRDSFSSLSRSLSTEIFGLGTWVGEPKK
jgi:hypothetical protein